MGGFKKGKIAGTAVVSAYCKSLNSLTAMDGRDRPLNNELRGSVVSCRVFIRLQSLIAR